MTNEVRGRTVYSRKSFRRGKVLAGNQVTCMIAIQWDDGGHEILHVSELMSEEALTEFKKQERASEMSLKPEQACVDAIVYASGTAAPLSKGTIVGPLNNDHVIVEWAHGEFERIKLDKLLSETDGITENQRLLDESRQLESDFRSVQSECRTKLAEAAKLIDEAAKLADKHGHYLLEMDDAVDPLEQALDAAGWNTSSWHC